MPPCCVVVLATKNSSGMKMKYWFKHILFHLHEKGLGRAQMLKDEVLKAFQFSTSFFVDRSTQYIVHH